MVIEIRTVGVFGGTAIVWKGQRVMEVWSDGSVPSVGLGGSHGRALNCTLSI